MQKDLSRLSLRLRSFQLVYVLLDIPSNGFII